MSNRCYLTSSNVETIYPSFADKKYDAPTMTIANDVERLPLLWLALFREGDLKHTTFDVRGEEVAAFAPLVAKDKALQQFDAAAPYLDKILPELGGLKEQGYIALFREAVAATPQKFLSIELEEIAGLYPETHRFEEFLTLALRGFDKPEEIHFECEDVEMEFGNLTIESMDGDPVDEELLAELNSMDGEESEPFIIEGFKADSHAEVLSIISGLRMDEMPLPSARMYVDDIEYTGDEQWNFTCLLGAGQHGSMGIGREVPWEKEDANFGWQMTMDDEEDLAFDDDEFEEDEDDEE